MKERTNRKIMAILNGVFALAALGMFFARARIEPDPMFRFFPVVIALLFGLRAFLNYRAYRRIPADDTRKVGQDVIERFSGGHARRWVFVVLAVLVGAFAFEAWSILAQGRFHYLNVLLGPPMLALTLGGLRDPRIMLSLRNDVPGVTPGMRRTAFTLVGVGLAVGALLLWGLMSGWGQGGAT